jgi:DNA-binding transcriptional ArsR family regulator
MVHLDHVLPPSGSLPSEQAVLATTIKTSLYLQTVTERFQNLLANLRAVAEPTRLRLLAVLSHGEFSVTELTQVLGQSQPRVSRHLKLLDDCGLLERFREQHWIYYRVPAETEAGRLARALLARLDPDDPVVVADMARVAVLLQQRSKRSDAQGEHSVAPERAHDEFTIELIGELGDPVQEALLYFGTAPAAVLGAIGPLARRIVGMNPDRQEVQRARALLHSRGLSHCVMQQGELKALPQASASFDVVVIDCALASEARPLDALREIARVMKPAGRLVLVEDYDALERRSASDHPLGLLRDWIAQAGLLCSRLRPVDVTGAQLLMAIATSNRAVAAA